ncbi:MAG: hypothetical protein IJ849_10795 [Selenomonadaceae bacterium]|nr:hypothetical protein [Selenomonadaceae bacterium]
MGVSITDQPFPVATGIFGQHLAEEMDNLKTLKSGDHPLQKWIAKINAANIRTLRPTRPHGY